MVKARRAHAARDAFDDRGILEPDDIHVLFDAVRREYDQHISAERPARTGECTVLIFLAIAHLFGDFGHVITRLQQRPVVLAHVGRPALIERLHIHIDKPFKQLVRVFLAVP